MDDLFFWSSARSKGIKDYLPGRVPMVTSAEINNGVVAYVEPFDDDHVFKGPALCVSGLGFATVQTGVFLPKGNGGDSSSIGVPRTPMSLGELVSICSAFNLSHSWRFTYGRKCSLSRLKPLTLPGEIVSAEDTIADEVVRISNLSLAIYDRFSMAENDEKQVVK